MATYTRKRKCVHIWPRIMGRLYHSSDRFFMVYVYYNSKSNSDNTLCWCWYHLLIGTLEDIYPINEGLIIYEFTKSVFILANSADPDETAHLGLRCLYMFPFRIHSVCSITAYFNFRLLPTWVSEHSDVSNTMSQNPKTAEGVFLEAMVQLLSVGSGPSCF